MENIVLKELKLHTEKGNKILVTSRCLVKFTMGRNLDDEALCK